MTKLSLSFFRSELIAIIILISMLLNENTLTGIDYLCGKNILVRSGLLKFQ